MSRLGGGLRAARDQNGERVAGAPRADRDLTSLSPAPAQQSRERLVGEAVPAIAEPLGHPLLIVLAQVEHEHAAAGDDDAGGFGDARAPGPAAWCSACDRMATSTDRVAQRHRSISPCRQVMLRTPRRLASAAGALEHRPRAIDRDHARRPSGWLRWSGSRRRSRGRRRAAAAAGARARAPTPPSCARARAGARAHPGRCAARSSPCAAAALPRAAHRRRGPSGSRPVASNCAWSSGHSGPKPLSASWRRGASRYQV